MKIQCKSPEAVVKAAFYLAYLACRGPVGMGVFQARDQASEEDVWANVRSAGDYPTMDSSSHNKPGSAYGDYVFGRMMKLGLSWGPDYVECKDDDALPRTDYQSWAGVFPTYSGLVAAAVAKVENAGS